MGKRALRCLAYLCFMLAGIGVSYYYAFCKSGAYYSNDVWSRVLLGSCITAVVALTIAWFANHFQFRTASQSASESDGLGERRTGFEMFSKPTAEIWIVVCLLALVSGRYVFSISEGKDERAALRKKLSDHHRAETQVAFQDFDPRDCNLLWMASPHRAHERLSDWLDEEIGRPLTLVEAENILQMAKGSVPQYRLNDGHLIVRENDRLRLEKSPD